MSDLHLEFADIKLPGGDVLILAGDIWLVRDMRNKGGNPDLRARYARFALEELKKYRKVLMVTGNHEAYGANIDEMDALIRLFLRVHAPNAELLSNETAIVDGVAFLGTPLWARCGVGKEKDELHVASYLNDFRLIRTDKPALAGSLVRFVGAERVFNPHDANRLHVQAVEWLKKELPRHKRCVVIGHHAPSFKSAGGHARYDDDSQVKALDTAYCSDLEALITAHPQIAVWIHGHTHRSENYMVGSTKVIANPRGYWPDEKVSRYFDPMACAFTIDELQESAAA